MAVKSHAGADRHAGHAMQDTYTARIATGKGLIIVLFSRLARISLRLADPAMASNWVMIVAATAK